MKCLSFDQNLVESEIEYLENFSENSSLGPIQQSIW